jgi:hypothetical protein
MFTELTNLARKRSAKEAVGFYLAYLLADLILVGLGGVFGSMLTGSSPYEQQFMLGVGTGVAISIVFCLLLSFLIIFQKKIYWNPRYILAALFGGALSFFGGGLLGMLMPAFLSTRKPANNLPPKTTAS